MGFPRCWIENAMGEIGALVVIDVQIDSAIDNKLLAAAQIIGRDNALGDGFDAGSNAITVKPAGEMTL